MVWRDAEEDEADEFDEEEYATAMEKELERHGRDIAAALSPTGDL